MAAAIEETIAALRGESERRVREEAERLERLREQERLARENAERDERERVESARLAEERQRNAREEQERIERACAEVNRNWQTSPGGAWAGEARFIGDSAKQIAVGRHSDGRLQIFYVGVHNNLYVNWQGTPKGPWLGEAQMPGASAQQGANAQQIAIAQNADGRMEIFYVGTNNVIYHNWQVTSAARSTTARTRLDQP